VSDIGDSGQVPGSAQRIGSAEREAAVKALEAHYAAGRLTPEEYEDRQVAASRATTWAEIAPLFADLPEPRPAPVAAALARTRTARTGPAGQGIVPIPDRTRETLMALVPFVALILFFVTKTWIWFLLIPVAGILLYGADHNRDHDRRRGRN
jgi:hypothetical protein